MEKRYYVIMVELKTAGLLNIVHNGNGFGTLEEAQFFMNEILSEEPSDFFDYFGLKIMEKILVEDKIVLTVLD